MRALKIAFPTLSYSEAMDKCELPTLDARREGLTKSFFKQMSRKDHKLNFMLPEQKSSQYHLRNEAKLPYPKCKTNRFKNRWIYLTAFLISSSIHSLTSI